MFKRRAFLHWWVVLVHGWLPLEFFMLCRYTGEGMDAMEFSEAESNTQDLMWVFLLFSYSIWWLILGWSCSAEYQQVGKIVYNLKLSYDFFFTVPRSRSVRGRGRVWRKHEWSKWSRRGRREWTIIKFAFILSLNQPPIYSTYSHFLSSYIFN